MSEHQHKYTFAGFNGPYFERKKQKEAADELTRETEKHGLHDDDDLGPCTWPGEVGYTCFEYTGPHMCNRCAELAKRVQARHDARATNEWPNGDAHTKTLGDRLEDEALPPADICPVTPFDFGGKDHV